MRRIMRLSGAAALVLLFATTANGQFFGPVGFGCYPAGYSGYGWGYGYGYGYRQGFWGYPAWNDPLWYGGRYGGWPFAGLGYYGPSAPAWVGRPVIYLPQSQSTAPYLAALTQPVRVGIDFLPRDFATPDLNTGAPALTDPAIVETAAKVSDAVGPLSASDLAILARHLRKTSNKETPADIAEAAARIRKTGVAAKMKASRLMDLGDDLFHDQKHHEALQRYKSATTAAPDMPETWLRQGFALAATGRYDLAARAFRRAKAIDAEALGVKLLLDDLYGDTAVAKTAHYDSLARAALAEPDRSDLLLVLGMMLHFDGQPERAAPFFAAVSDLDSAAAAEDEETDEAEDGGVREASDVRDAGRPAAPVIGVET